MAGRKGMQSPAGKVHVLWNLGPVELLQLSPKSRFMVGLNASLRASFEKFSQAAMFEASDHSCIVA